MCDSKIIGKEFIARGLQCVGIREIPVVDDWSDRKCKEDAWESKNVRKNKEVESNIVSSMDEMR